MKKILLLVSMLAMLLLVVACAPTEPAVKAPVEEVSSEEPISTVPSSYDVVIENSAFMPTDLEVKVGDTVTWTNKDTIEHTFTLESGDVDEKLPSGASYTHTFNEKGQYGYFCQIHPGMQGSVTVN